MNWRTPFKWAGRGARDVSHLNAAIDRRLMGAGRSVGRAARKRWNKPAYTQQDLFNERRIRNQSPDRPQSQRINYRFGPQ